MGRENRASVRIRNVAPVRVAAFDGKRVPDESRFVECAGHDLSTGGCAFIADQFAVRDELILKLELPGVHELFIAAEVARTGEDIVDHKTTNITGCRFKYGIEIVGPAPRQWYLIRSMQEIFDGTGAGARN